MNAADLLHWLMRTTLEASLLIVAVLGLRLMLGTRLSPAWRIGLWMIVGLKLMLPAFIPVGFCSGHSGRTQVTAVTQGKLPSPLPPSIKPFLALLSLPSPHSPSFTSRHSDFGILSWLSGSPVPYSSSSLPAAVSAVLTAPCAAVQALHWFNPLVWFVVSRFQADRELRCDAGALALLSPTERLDYRHTLLRIHETFFAPPAIAGLAPCVRNNPTLRQRILMITTPTTRQPWLHALLVLTLSVLVC